MKIRNFVLALTVLLSSTAIFAQKVEVNTEKSTVKWHGEKIGGEHEGFIQIKSGHLEMKNDKIVDGTIVIDMNSITNTDLTDEGYNQKLVGHLKSDDFFGVENYPTASLELIKSTKFSDGKATVTGNLNIKGKTEKVSFEVLKKGNAYTATMEIDRSKFDVRYGSDSFFDNLGDKAIDDIFTLDINLVVK
jgi:polyisoprenoid-binding protein YceI